MRSRVPASEQASENGRARAKRSPGVIGGGLRVLRQAGRRTKWSATARSNSSRKTSRSRATATALLRRSGGVLGGARSSLVILSSPIPTLRGTAPCARTRISRAFSARMIDRIAGVLEVLTPPGGVVALLQVTMIDLVLAGDNAIVIGLAAAGVAAPPRPPALPLVVLLR